MVNNKNLPLATWVAPKDSFKLGSIAEDLFIDIFAEVFGPENTKYLSIQHPFVDIYGNSRFIDFALESEGQKIAIEIDGETWHNPSKVSQDKYYDDLLKQNSLIYENWKIYRWVYNQLHTKPEMVKDELQTFLGELPMFKELEEYLPKQKGKAFVLKDHQAEAIASLENMRKNNETIALLYHATGNMYYGNKSSSWGNGGVSFLDIEVKGQALGRMYLITRNQLEDISSQEGRGENWYNHSVKLGEQDGIEIITITNKVKRESHKPSNAYLDVIRRGIKETYTDMEDFDVMGYLSK